MFDSKNFITAVMLTLVDFDFVEHDQQHIQLGKPAIFLLDLDTGPWQQPRYSFEERYMIT